MKRLRPWLAAFAVLSCLPSGGAADEGAVVAFEHRDASCAARLEVEAEERALRYRGDCSDPGAVAARLIAGSEALGARVSEAAWIFFGVADLGGDRLFRTCALLEALATDPGWTAAPDPTSRARAFRALDLTPFLDPALVDALARRGRAIARIEVEKLQIGGPAWAEGSGCATVPDRVPFAAQVWLGLGPG